MASARAAVCAHARITDRRTMVYALVGDSGECLGIVHKYIQRYTCSESPESETSGVTPSEECRRLVLDRYSLHPFILLILVLIHSFRKPPGRK